MEKYNFNPKTRQMILALCNIVVIVLAVIFSSVANNFAFPITILVFAIGFGGSSFIGVFLIVEIAGHMVGRLDDIGG